MIKFENTEICGIKHAIRGMRNAMNSWDKSDSYVDERYNTAHIRENDKALMKRLFNAGTDHRKYLRMITVYTDITAPLYWWKEYETKDIETFRTLIGLLPSSYNQKRTVMLNYEVLANIYKSRQGHKLKEWHDFIEWIEGLPYTDIFK